MAWVKEEDKPKILFRRCLGLNDTGTFATQVMDVNSGTVELTDCLNITTTPDGCIEKIAPFVTALTHSAPLTDISVGTRFVYQDGTDTKEWDGVNVTTIGAIMAGSVAHTSVDVRLATASKVYKSDSGGAALLEATLGDTSNIPDTSKPYYAQPVYKQAFTYNGIMYGINSADPRFLQYSEYGHFDVYALGDSFIGHEKAILQAGAIPGVMVCIHANGVSAYTGENMAGFQKKFYSCKPLDGTLYSGYIGKSYSSGGQTRTYDYGHVFLCADGVYLITVDGAMTNLSESVSRIGTLNSSYSCATLHDSKYLAFGNSVTIEYDFETGSVLKRSTLGVVSATVWNNVNYYAVGSTISTAASSSDTGNITASLTLPFSEMGARGTKSLYSLYFTGTIGGTVTFTATDQQGKQWSVEVSDIGTVSNYRIKTPKGMLGNHISMKVDCLSGAFRMEELRAELAGTTRNI